MVNPRTVVWRGSQLPAHEQGIKVFCHSNGAGGCGNVKFLPEWNVTSTRGPFSPALLMGRKLFKGLREVVVLVPSPPPIPPRTALLPVWSVPLTLLATTVQFVPVQGCWPRRGSAFESVAARLCREAGARVTTNVMVRDLDLEAMNVQDGRYRGRVASPWRGTVGDRHYDCVCSAL